MLSNSKEAYSFIKDFTANDLYCISVPGSSTSIWQMSPPSIENLKELLSPNGVSHVVSLDFMYTLTREASEEQNEQLSEIVTGSHQIDLNNKTKADIYYILTNSADTVYVSYFLCTIN
jgi:hypothetical protein